MLGDAPIGSVYWPAGPSGPAALGETVNGLPCGITHDAISYHVHTHLSVFLNGTQLRIPNNLGIGGPSAPRPGCMYALHTHDATGVIHVENPVPARFTLGQFFQLWGQPLSTTNVAGITGLPVVVWIVDNRNTLTRYDGDPNDIELRASRGIVLQIGSPLTVIPTYRYGSE